MKLDTVMPGLYALFPPHKAAFLQRLYEKTTPRSRRGQTTREIWDWHNDYAERTGESKVSRATVINGLNNLADEGILKYEEETCKGGHRRLFAVAMTPEELETHIRKEIGTKLDRIFYTTWWRIPQ